MRLRRATCLYTHALHTCPNPSQAPCASHDVFYNNHVEQTGYPFAKGFQFGGVQSHNATLRRNRMITVNDW